MDVRVSKLIACIAACLIPIAALALPITAGSGLSGSPALGEPRQTGALVQALSTETATPEDAEKAGGAEEAVENSDPDLPNILRSENALPEPVRETRRKLLEAARSGEMERLRALMEEQPEPPSVSFGDPGDPIEYLKQLSSDANGREILAILQEVLESGFVRVAPGTPEELYVWPYFAQYPLEALTPAQLVELFTIITSADLEDMKSYGGYTFFRVGIAPDGRWLFFVAGD
jgi:hypothetical protein